MTLGAKEASSSIIGMPSSIMDFPFRYTPSRNLMKPQAWSRSRESVDHSPVGPGKGSSLCQPTVQAWPQESFWKKRKVGAHIQVAPASPGPSVCRVDTPCGGGPAPCLSQGTQPTLLTALGCSPHNGAELFSLTITILHNPPLISLPIPFLQNVHLFRNTSIHSRNRVFGLTKE